MSDLVKFDLNTRNMLAMMELIVDGMGDAIKETIVHPELTQQIMADMVEYHNKLKKYTKEQS